MRKIRFRSNLLAAVAIVAFVLTPLAGAADGGRTAGGEPSAEAMIADMILLRPLGLCATVIGLGIFLVSLPFTAVAGNHREAAKKLIAEPASYTFNRPLGHAEP